MFSFYRSKSVMEYLERLLRVDSCTALSIAEKLLFVGGSRFTGKF